MSHTISKAVTTHIRSSRVKTATFFIVASFLISCNEKPASLQPSLQSLPVITIQTNTATTFKEYPSSIEGIDNIEVRPEISGKLGRILVDEGEYVEKGQLLFEIDDYPYQERLHNAKAILHAAQGALTSAELEVEKLAPLVKNNVVSSYQLKTAEAAKEMAEGSLAQAKAGVRIAQIELGYTKVIAPTSGYLGRLRKKQGSVISPGDPEALTLLSDIHKVHSYFSMSEIDFLNFKSRYAGKTVEDKLKNIPPVELVLSDGSIYPVSGHINMVDGQFNKNTGAVTVRAIFDNPDRILRSGNTGKIRLGYLHENVAIIPQAATIEIQDKVLVFVLGDSNKVSKHPIKIAGKSDEEYFVNEGIPSGTKIIASGIEHISEGEKIIPQEHTLSLQEGEKIKRN